MSKYLDLIKDGFDELIGKHIAINSVNYEIVDTIHVGGEKVVVSLKNLNTGLILQAARIYKVKYGTPLYAATKKAAEAARFIHHLRSDYREKPEWKQPEKYEDQFLLGLHLSDIAAGLDINPGNIIIQNVPKDNLSALDFIDSYELYEIGGGLIQFQPLLDSSTYMVNESRLINEAALLFFEKKYEQMHKVVDEILLRNPRHTDALLFKGGTLCFEGSWLVGINILQDMLTLEPNYENYYQNTVNVLLRMNKPRHALTILAFGLNRYSDNIMLFDRLISIICDEDFIELFSEYYNSYVTKLNPEYANYLIEKHTESLKRFIDFRNYFDTALELLMKQDWNNAMPLLEQALNATTRTCWANYNLAICHFYLGQYERVIDLLKNEMLLPELPELADFALLLLALAYLKIEDKSTATSIFETIYDRINDPLDLPMMPIAFVFATDNAMGGVQTKNAAIVLGCLQALMVFTPQNKKLPKLHELYQQCENRFLNS